MKHRKTFGKQKEKCGLDFRYIEKKAWRCFQKIENGIEKIKRMEAETMLSLVNEGILVMYVLFLTKRFLDSTMFRIHWPEYFQDAIIVVTIMLLVLKLLLTRNYELGELIVIGVFTGVFLMARTVSGYGILGEVLLFMLALWGIPFDKILRIHFVIVSFLLVVTIVCSQIGMVDNLVYHFEGRRERQSFGGCYPTDFAAYFVWLSLAWVYIRKEKLKFAEIGMILLAGVGVWYFCDARLSMAVLFLSGLVFFGIKLRHVYLEHMMIESGEIKQRIDDKKVMSNWLLNLLVFAMPLCAVVMITLSYCFSFEQPVLAKLDSLLSGRLLLGKIAFERFDVKLFGQFVPMVGFGRNTVTYIAGSNYFFLDSSFMTILMCYGCVLFFFIIAAFMNSAFRAKKRNDYYLVLIIALIALDCMVEHHMMEIWYNPFLLLLLSDVLELRERKARSDSWVSWGLNGF